MSKSHRVAIVGASGAVGVEMLRVMERRNFPVASLRLLASPRSAGKTLTFRGEELTVEPLHLKLGALWALRWQDELRGFPMAGRRHIFVPRWRISLTSSPMLSVLVLI
jgi:hypothetical protein